MTDSLQPSVLLVDDVEANLVALEALLSDMGCQLVRADSGNAALKLLLKREFAVVLLDVQMPEMDGYEVARHARENPATEELPIIFLTAMHDNEDSMLRGYGSGAVDFLLKPVNSYVLRAKVRIFLDLYLSRRALSLEVDAHKRTLAELQLSNTALHHFTNAASHDLRAPLRAIRGFLGLLAKEAEPSLAEQATDYLQRSLRAAERMDSLLNALLSYARLRKPSAAREVDCQSVAEQVLGDLSEHIAHAGASVELGPLPSLLGDPDRLYQLLLNLLSNALKFRRLDVAPIIRITAQQQPETVTFSVEDNGIGIAPAHRQHVFAAFARLHDQASYAGSGLGLTICQQIVEQLGGSIWVESSSSDGARFCVRLPRSQRSHS